MVPNKCGSRTHSPARPTRDELSEPLDFLDCYCIDEQTNQNVWSRYKIFMTLFDLTRCKGWLDHNDRDLPTCVASTSNSRCSAEGVPHMVIAVANNGSAA